MSEKEVFEQKISEEEMNSVAGGSGESNSGCDDCRTREIYDPSFPNCAATVEDGSRCLSNDACFEEAVVYLGMKECIESWK